jgi:hypothetical protein
MTHTHEVKNLHGATQAQQPHQYLAQIDTVHAESKRCDPLIWNDTWSKTFMAQHKRNSPPLFGFRLAAGRGAWTKICVRDTAVLDSDIAVSFALPISVWL